MEHYLLEAALLMLAAYLVGAMLGCVLRRALHPEVDTTAPVEATAAAASAGTAANAAAASIRETPEPVQPKIETVAHPTPPQETKVAESARFERVLTSAPAGAAATAAVAATAAAAAASAPPRATEPEPRLPAASSGTGTTAVAAPIAVPADDLRKISGVDSETANHLNQLGYTRFSQIADWRSDDVARIRKAFGDNRASNGGWIEQAKILADGKQTRHLRRLSEGAPENPWALTAAAAAAAVAVAASAPPATAKAPPPMAEPAAAPAVPPAAPDPGPQDLSLIKGVDGNAARLLSENGVTTYRQIAGWTAADVERFDTLLSERGRVSGQNWIEQAKVLSDGKDTAFIQRMKTTPMPVSAPSGGLLSPLPLPSASTANTGIASAAAAASAAVAATTAASQSDDLKRTASAPDPVPRPGSIAASGGVATAALKGAPEAPLPAAPAPTEPVAATPPPQPEFTPPAPPAPEPDTEPLEPDTEPLQPAAAAEEAPRPSRLADAIRQNAANMGTSAGAAASGVAGMRSVRSQLLSGAGAEKPDTVDDLKKIRGIGVLIEKKLNAMGVYSYDQIANWSADDIQRVSSALDFKGRIEREGWVQQARILASGGQTEFSKRLT
jgi:predicted flap endonuclease-1-like 5' DNA nuclease